MKIIITILVVLAFGFAYTQCTTDSPEDLAKKAAKAQLAQKKQAEMAQWLAKKESLFKVPPRSRLDFDPTFRGETYKFDFFNTGPIWVKAQRSGIDVSEFKEFFTLKDENLKVMDDNFNNIVFENRGDETVKVLVILKGEPKF